MLIKQFFTAFQLGKSLANSATWKNRAMLGNALFGFLSALVTIGVAFGYDLSSLDSETVQALAGGIVAFITAANVIVHCATSDKVGIVSPADKSDNLTDTDSNYKGRN